MKKWERFASAWLFLRKGVRPPSAFSREYVNYCL